MAAPWGCRSSEWEGGHAARGGHRALASRRSCDCMAPTWPVVTLCRVADHLPGALEPSETWPLHSHPVGHSSGVHLWNACVHACYESLPGGLQGAAGPQRPSGVRWRGLRAASGSPLVPPEPQALLQLVLLSAREACAGPPGCPGGSLKDGLSTRLGSLLPRGCPTRHLLGVLSKSPQVGTCRP